MVKIKIFTLENHDSRTVVLNHFRYHDPLDELMKFLSVCSLNALVHIQNLYAT